MRQHHSLKSVISFLLGVGLLSSGYAQAEWIKNYSAAAYDVGSMQPAKAGGFYLNLNSAAKATGAKNKPLLSLLDNDGNPNWVKQITTGNYDTFYASELANGQLLLQGSTQTTATGKTNPVWALYNVNAETGALTQVFKKTWEGKGNDYLFFTEDSQGDLVGTGSTTTFNSAGKNDMVLTKVSASTGVPVWSKVYDYNSGDDVVVSFTPKGNNRYLLLANSEASNGSNQKILIGLIKSDGVPATGSFKVYGNNEVITASGVKAISGGNYLVFGTVKSSSNDQYPSVFVMKLNSNLVLQWAKSYSAGADESLSISDINENSDHSLTVSSNLTGMQYINVGGFPVPVGLSAHPTAIKLSANGSFVSATSYNYQASDVANWSQLPGGSYLLTGSTTPAFDPTKPKVIPNTDMLYGHFNAQLAPNWVKTFATDLYDGGSIMPYNTGYLMNAATIDTQSSNFDVVAGVLNSNGDVAGCSNIQDVTMTETTPSITESTLNWQGTSAAIKKKGVVTPADVALKVSNATVTVTPVCGN